MLGDEFLNQQLGPLKAEINNFAQNSLKSNILQHQINFNGSYL